MRVIQILPSITAGDAVSNDVFRMDKALKQAGFDTHIYADMIGKNVDRNLVSHIDLCQSGKGDILLYHMSIGSRINSMLADMPGRKVFVYHNITPAGFFKGYNPYLEQKCRRGLLEIEALKDVPDYVLAVSEYNKNHLRELGYTCPIDVLPILLPMEDYGRTADADTLQKYGDGCVNILFTGRIVPNKKFEDVIEAFYAYHENFNQNSRLLLVGNDAGTESYRRELENYVKYLGLSEQEVCFTGHVSFEQLLACYRTASVFVCMSEHEGFCIPLLEAMYFDVPVVAYDAGAVAETLGGAGILLNKKEPKLTAAVFDVLCKEEELRKQIMKEQRKRLTDFDETLSTERFLTYIKNLI